MSEAQLHVLRGGILNQARRGELEVRLPIGFVYDAQQRVRLDPDARVQESVRQLFRTFRRTGSATATVKAFREQGLAFPRRVFHGPHKGEVLWGDLEHSRVLRVLHHPRYAGAFCFGRSRQRHHPDGHTSCVRLPREDWTALIHDAHEAYIAWEDYEQNLQVLQDTANAQGADRERGAPREGPALLQGLAVCAVCGERMTLRYHTYRGRQVPEYLCQRRGDRARPPGLPADSRRRPRRGDRTAAGRHGDAADPGGRAGGAAGARAARRRMRAAAPPGGRAGALPKRAGTPALSAGGSNRLEADWNTALRALVQAQERYEHQRQAEAAGLSEAQRASILALAQDFPRLWNDPQTPDRERMARLLIADVTLLKAGDIAAQVRFRGGATHTLHLPLPKAAWLHRQTSARVVQMIDTLLDDYTDAETAARLDVAPATIKNWRRAGLLVAHRDDDKGQCLFEPPGPDAPEKFRHQGKTIGRSAASRRNIHPATV